MHPRILLMQLAGVSEMDDHAHKKLTKTPHGIEEIRAIRDTTNRVTNNYNIDSSTHLNSRYLNIKFVIVQSMIEVLLFSHLTSLVDHSLKKFCTFFMGRYSYLIHQKQQFHRSISYPHAGIVSR